MHYQRPQTRQMLCSLSISSRRYPVRPHMILSRCTNGCVTCYDSRRRCLSLVYDRSLHPLISPSYHHRLRLRLRPLPLSCYGKRTRFNLIGKLIKIVSHTVSKKSEGVTLLVHIDYHRPKSEFGQVDKRRSQVIVSE